MVPTERALQLDASVRIVLGEIESSLAPAAEFDPATTKLCFRIGTPDYLALPMMANLISYLRMTAPKARLVLQPHSNGYDCEAALTKPPIDLPTMCLYQLRHSGTAAPSSPKATLGCEHRCRPLRGRRMRCTVCASRKPYR